MTADDANKENWRRTAVSRMTAPRSVALVGASPRATAAASIVRANLKRLGYPGRVHLVNPKYETIGEQVCHPSLDAVEDEIDAVFVGVGGSLVLPVVEHAAKLGASGVVVNAANVPEADATLMSEVARAHEIGICGPNTVGWLNLRTRSGLWTVITCPVARGPLAAITHSGTVAMILTEGVRGVGFDAVFTCGNEVGLSAADYLDYLADEDSVRAIAMFLEVVREPEAFEAAAWRATESGKQLFAVKVGRTTKGAGLVATHSGAIAGDDRIYRAFLESSGVQVVDDLDELLEASVLGSAADAMSRSPSKGGTRAALITLSGGLGALAVDLSEEMSLELPDLTDETKKRISEAFPSILDPDNPLDAWGSGWDPAAVAGTVEALAAQDDIDVVAALLDAPQGGTGEIQEAIAIGNAFSKIATAAPGRRFVLVNANGQGPPHPEVVDALRLTGVACLSGLRPSLKAIAGGQHARGFRAPEGPQAVDQIELSGTRREWESLLLRFGVNSVPREVVTSDEEATELAERWGYPVVLKGWHPQLLHKTERGLVSGPIYDRDSLARAVRAMAPAVEALRSGLSDAALVVEQFVPHDLELIVGVRNVLGFGSYALLGMGGLFADAFDAAVVVRGPIDEEQAAELLSSPKFARLLRNERAQRYQTAALARQFSALSHLGASTYEHVVSIEVNPLVPKGDGRFIALDFAAQHRRPLKNPSAKGGAPNE